MHLLFFSDIAWEHLYQRPQQLAVRLAQQWPVLWIEPATLGAPRKWTSVRHAERLHILTLPQLPHNARDSRIRTIARFLSAVPGFRRCLTALQLLLLRRAAKHLGIDLRRCAAVIENFQFASLLERIHPPVVLFDYIDDAFGFTDYPAYVRDEWSKTVQMATAVTATSSALKTQIERERPVSVHLLENGVDTSLYRQDIPSLRPADLPAGGRPLIIYVGTLARWFDFALLTAAVQRYPEYEFVLVGPVHTDVRDELSALHVFQNVHTLDRRAYGAIPAYLRSSTVGMIPFLRNRLTEAVNPVKLYEYTAAGLPVVTTAFSDDLKRFRDVAFIGRTTEEFLLHIPAAIGAARDAGTAVRLRTFAAQHDWSTRSAELASLLQQHLEYHTNQYQSP